MTDKIKQLQAMLASPQGFIIALALLGLYASKMSPEQVDTLKSLWPLINTALGISLVCLTGFVFFVVNFVALAHWIFSKYIEQYRKNVEVLTDLKDKFVEMSEYIVKVFDNSRDCHDIIERFNVFTERIERKLDILIQVQKGSTKYTINPSSTDSSGKTEVSVN